MSHEPTKNTNILSVKAQELSVGRTELSLAFKPVVGLSRLLLTLCNTAAKQTLWALREHTAAQALNGRDGLAAYSSCPPEVDNWDSLAHRVRCATGPRPYPMDKPYRRCGRARTPSAVLPAASFQQVEKTSRTAPASKPILGFECCPPPGGWTTPCFQRPWSASICLPRGSWLWFSEVRGFTGSGGLPAGLLRSPDFRGPGGAEHHGQAHHKQLSKQ